MSIRQVVLLLTNNLCLSTQSLFKEIADGVDISDDAFMLYHHQPGNEIPGFLTEVNSHIFTDDILYNLGYVPLFNKLLPGSNHFPLLDFYKKYSSYDYYWIIEDDVRFTGDWLFFFQYFSKLEEYDLVTSHVRFFEEEPYWYWWDTLKHSRYFIPFESRIRSFNPIYRVSRKALELLSDVLDMKWIGHHEVLLPTIISLGNLKLLDFGGNGRFVLPGSENKFYTSENEIGALKKGTMRFRPVRRNAGPLKNKLYHPVKAKHSSLL
ncbi:hypothetical protein [Chitinophaga sancti]|uniref:hypothetical protein n=1 Tax=Chitinophaga sancti TaxID=1004 RepID=UPI003F79B321